MARVTGIGGVFFKARDREALKEWYGRHLGIPTEEWGAAFYWRERHVPRATRSNSGSRAARKTGNQDGTMAVSTPPASTSS